MVPLAPKILTNSPDLFGNDAAEDETAAVFDSYSVEHPIEADLQNPTLRLLVVRAYKGEGKSALLRRLRGRLAQSAEPSIVAAMSAHDLSADAVSMSAPDPVRQWKAAILARLAGEIGKTIRVASQDDAMSLVEFAERGGYKQRNLVSALGDRLLEKLPLGDRVPSRELQVDALGGTVERWLKRRPVAWVHLDDIDNNFDNTDSSRRRVVACFDALRSLVATIDGLCIRAAIRPVTWAQLTGCGFESLDKVEQYVRDLRWDETDFSRLLGGRVLGYLRRNQSAFSAGYSINRPDQLIQLSFESPVVWGGEQKPISIVLWNLSRHRPRWAVQLCRLAGSSAAGRRAARISLQDVVDQLREFGALRVRDLAREFHIECAETESLIMALRDGPEEFSQDDLQRFIAKAVLSRVMPRIAGVSNPSALEVARYLFRIGVITAKRNLPGAEYEHYSFEDRPSLLAIPPGAEDPIRWEVHPVFRQFLGMRDGSGHSPKRFKNRG